MQDRGTGGINLENADGMLGPLQNRRVKPQAEQPQKCPRCDSLNTKFCYYNNYSLSQPRYFCKTCRRYWTKGGTLRNVPVGGGCRKGGKRPRRLVTDNPTSSSSHQDEKSNFLSPIFSAIRPPFLMDQWSTGVKLSAGVSSFPSLMPFGHGMTMGEYGAILNAHQEPLVASAPQQTPPSLPNTGGLVNDIESWRIGDVAAVDSIGAKDGLLHLLPPFPSSGAAGNVAAASGSPALKTETETVYESSTTPSAGACYWNSSGSSLVGGQWQDFPGYGPSNSFL